ncbi:MAG: UvrD-helicase domain-containing protein [Clostridia bacterium]|nr:UvrD-helicase domain-containing protein [Clostridia bacterium]
MAIQYTPAQRTAIQYGRGNLLLSAAAGSGKTATLTGRILHLLESGEASLPEMLIVTYTRAAAAELRERIGSGILEAAKKNTGRKMAENLAAVGNAEISTIHSFLYRNLRPYFASLGLSPDFSIGDEAVMESLRQEAMRDTLDDFFDRSAGEGIGADFIALADALSGARDAASLDKTLLSMAARITAAGKTPAVLLTYADAIEEGAKNGFFTMPQSEPIKKRLLLLTDHTAKGTVYCLNAFRDTPKVMEKYGESAEELLAYCAYLEKTAAENNYTALRTALQDFSLTKLKNLPAKDATDASVLFKDIRDTCKKEIAKLADRYFSSPEEVLADTLLRTADLLRSASVVLDGYFAAYRMKKYNRSLLDYNDLESFALNLFLDENGNPTSAAKEVGRKYKYIFIDEYQDTNRVQDAIFRAISDHSTRFMVGDIKQSVYRFRGAEPSVFSHYRDIWDTVAPDGEPDGAFAPDEGRCLFMSENFRCDETVVDFVNLVSDVLFTSGGIPYTKEDALVFGKSGGGNVPAEICLIEKNRPDEEENPETVDPEAEYVAKRIADMLGQESIDGVRPIVPGDIAILLRSPDTSAGEYRTALAKRGIPVTLQNTPLLFTSPAVLLVLCLLHTADNPLSDIYTAGLMHSPLFGFTTEDLVRLQRFGGEVPLYVRVKMAVLPEEEWAFPTDAEEEPDEADGMFAGEEDETGLEADWGTAAEEPAEEKTEEALPDELLEKCRRFLAAVDALRTGARGMRADRFLDTVYREYALYELPEILENAAEQGNLQALYEIARRYESGTFGGIAGFLQYIEELKGKEKEKMPEADGGAVTILSIHRSKGLEYPVVFLCECAKKRNTRDEEGDILYDADLGFGMRLPDPGGLVRCGTALRSGIGEKIRRDGIEEEMRVLYVALTRARNRLIITAKMKDAEGALETYRQYGELVTPWRIVDGSSYIDWILTAVHHHGFSPCYTIRTVDYRTGEETHAETDAGAKETADSSALTEKLRQNCDFVYPYAYLANIPAKLTVSGLYPTILDEEDTPDETPLSRILDPRDTGETAEQKEKPIPLPRFMTGMTDTVTPADRGTATHVFLQFADLGALKENGAEAELTRLTESHYITQEMAENVYTDQIEKFRQSELFRRMCSAGEIYREFRFNAAMDASRFTGSGELAEKLTADGIKLTVQGVVDCVFRDERGYLVLVDYKTDHPYREEYHNPALADERFRNRHGEQLRYYKEICEKMFGEEIGETIIYSTALAREILV